MTFRLSSLFTLITKYIRAMTFRRSTLSSLSCKSFTVKKRYSYFQFIAHEKFERQHQLFLAGLNLRHAGANVRRCVFWLQLFSFDRRKELKYSLIYISNFLCEKLICIQFFKSPPPPHPPHPPPPPPPTPKKKMMNNCVILTLTTVHLNKITRYVLFADKKIQTKLIFTTWVGTLDVREYTYNFGCTMGNSCWIYDRMEN